MIARIKYSRCFEESIEKLFFSEVVRREYKAQDNHQNLKLFFPYLCLVKSKIGFAKPEYQQRIILVLRIEYFELDWKYFHQHVQRNYLFRSVILYHNKKYPKFRTILFLKTCVELVLTCITNSLRLGIPRSAIRV